MIKSKEPSRLILWNDEKKIARLRLKGEIATIGRGFNSDLQIFNETVSREHGKFIREGYDWSFKTYPDSQTRINDTY